MIYAAWLIWAVPIISVPFIPLIGLVSQRGRNWFAVLASALTAFIGFYLAASFSSGMTESSIIWLPIFKVPVQVLVDGTSVLLAAFISFLSFLIVLYSVGYMKGEKGQSRYYSLILLFVGAMLGLVMAGNLIQLYFFWEIVGICSAFLIAFWYDKPEARRAGLKAFVVTRFGDIALFIAVLIVLANLKTTNYASIFSAIGSRPFGPNTVLLVGVLLLIGAMGKSAQVPLHVWLPDAMEGPTPVSALIHAATMVNAGVYLVIRMFPLFSYSSTLLVLVTIVGLTSMIFGAACAVVSEDLKRILAYSTISQLGIMFASIGVGTALGATATYHLISQGLFKALAFLAAGSVITATGSRNVEELGGLRKSMKYTYIGFLFAMLAMSGVPPLIGFWSKDWIVSTALTSNVVAAILIVLSSVLTTIYSFRALFKVFHGKSKLPNEPKESATVMIVPIMTLVVSVTVGWLVLDYQRLVPFNITIDPLTIGMSLAAIASGIGIVYVAFSSRTAQTQSLMGRNAPLIALRKYLLEGLGLDKFYGFLYSRIVLPLAKISTYLESGWLGVNMGLMLASVLLIIFLVALKVI